MTGIQALWIDGVLLFFKFGFCTSSLCNLHRNWKSGESGEVSVEKLHLTYLGLDLKEISCHCEQCFDTVHSTLFGSDSM